MECGGVGLHPRTFIPDIRTHPPGMALPRTAWIRFNRPAPVSDVSAPTSTNRVWPFLRLVSPIRRRLNVVHDLTVLDDEKFEWLL